ncbi:MAG: hypothetical protein RL227_2740, partial [Pseudomonadota bacterium]
MDRGSSGGMSGAISVAATSAGRAPGAAAEQRARGPRWAEAAGSASARAEPADDSAPMRRPLPRNDFLPRLRHERQRAERSGAPLSLISYRLDGAGAIDLPGVERLLEALHRCKRETDLVGYTAPAELAVLCPETSGEGVRTLARKVHERLGGSALQADVATFPEGLFSSIERRTEPPTSLLTLLDPAPANLPAQGYVGKRSLDIVLTLLALALLWPLMLLVAVLVVMDSPGPALFRQQRMGRQARLFTFYKFRSMRAGGDDALHRRYVKQLIEGQAPGEAPAAGPGDGAPPSYKMQADPRVTRV